MSYSLIVPFNPADNDSASVYDEAPLWSLPFGMMLLDHIKFSERAKVLDIGCGAGFPLIETAQRFGLSAQLYGVDPWHAGLERLKYKISVMNIKNIKLHEAKAEKLSFKDNFFDVIISNNGLNNVDNPAAVLNECYRTARRGAQLIFTANLPGTMNLFYECLKASFIANGISNTGSIKEHITHKRKTIKENKALAENAGFKIKAVYRNSFKYRFIDGSAFLNYYFVRWAFMESWENLIPENKRKQVFRDTEFLLNKKAKEGKGITLNIPFACYDCYKP